MATGRFQAVMAALLMATLGTARAAVAEEPNGEGDALDARGTRAFVAPVAGALTAFVPLVAGAALWANSGRGDLQKAGTYVMASGFAAAPWVCHGIAGRWRRAAVFGSISAATSAAALIAMEAKDPFYPAYKNRERVPFGVLLTSAMFAAAVGVLDSFLVGPADKETLSP
jgi:hypothetical protein